MDFSDTATLHEEQFLEVALAKTKAQIERAQGTGTNDCMDCGEPIPVARRQALPSACRCAECQSTREHYVKRGLR